MYLRKSRVKRIPRESGLQGYIENCTAEKQEIANIEILSDAFSKRSQPKPNINQRQVKDRKEAWKGFEKVEQAKHQKTSSN